MAAGVRTAAPVCARTGRVEILDPLRGLAALAVCLFHFTGSPGAPGYFPAGDPLAGMGAYGRHGVETFFVISGFVIPLMLERQGYRPGAKEAATFLWRRFARLSPAYAASIVLILVVDRLAALAPGYRGEPPHVSVPQLLAHLTYLVPFLGYDWLNGAFWTLAVEFQFYALMALVFPVVVAAAPGWRVAAAPCIAAGALLGPAGSAFVPHWLPVFALGIMIFQYHAGLVTWRRFLVCVVAITMISLGGCGVAATVSALATVAVIVGCRNLDMPRWLSPLVFAGTISYALYLVHLPLGGRVINLAARLPSTAIHRFVALAAAYAVSIVAATILWRCVDGRRRCR